LELTHIWKLQGESTRGEFKRGDTAMKQTKPWHEDDAFWKMLGPVMFTPKRLAEAATHAEQIVALLGVKPPLHILDLGCGVGRHSLELARRGFTVTGVDRTAEYLETAEKRAEEEGLTVEFVQDDMRSFCRPDTYDAIISMFTSFSYFEDPQEDHQVVANASTSLKRGGTFLVDTHGKETLSRIFRERDWDEIDGVLVLQERRVTQHWSWMELRWILIDGDKRSEATFSHRLYSATEMVSMMKDCGFSDASVYGDLLGSTYDHTAKRMILVGCK